MVRGQRSPCSGSLELPTRGGLGGGMLRKGERRDGRIVGEGVGGEICDGKGGAGV